MTQSVLNRQAIGELKEPLSASSRFEGLSDVFDRAQLVIQMPDLLSLPDELILDLIDKMQEVKEYAASFPGLQDVACLARTCKRLHCIATPPLYEHITVSSHGMILLKRTLDDYPVNAENIKCLEIYPTSMRFSSQKIQTWRQEHSGQLPSTSSIMSSILTKCVNLEEFVFEHSIKYDELLGKDVTVQRWANYLRALAGLQQLKTLRIGSLPYKASEVIPLNSVATLSLVDPGSNDYKFLTVLCPSLTTLTFDVVMSELMAYAAPELFFMALTTVKRLSVNANLSTDDIIFCLRLVGTQLEVLDIYAMSLEIAEEAGEVRTPVTPFKLASPSLRLQLVYVSYQAEDDEEIEEAFNKVADEVLFIGSASGCKNIHVHLDICGTDLIRAQRVNCYYHAKDGQRFLEEELGEGVNVEFVYGN